MDEARKTRATYNGYSSGLVKGTCLSKSAESVSQSQRAIQTNISQYRKRCRRIAHMEHDRQRAIAEFKRVMLWIGVAGVLMVIGALSYLGINGHMTFVVAVATIAGVFLSVMLGFGLFAGEFFSDKRGRLGKA